MKLKLFPLIMAAVAVATLSFVPACQTTGDPAKDAQTYWNSPAMQAFLTNLQTEAFTILNSYVTSFGSTRAMSASSAPSQAAQDYAFNRLKAAHPGVADSVLRGAVAQAAKTGG